MVDLDNIMSIKEHMDEAFKFDPSAINKALDIIANEIAHLNYKSTTCGLMLAEALGAAHTQIVTATKMYYMCENTREEMISELSERTKAEIALKNIKEKQKQKRKK